MRAALYARVACASQQTKHALASQLEALRDYAASNAMKTIEECTDEGYSGLRLDRPGLDRIRDLAQRCGFDVLLTCGPDRLARSFSLQTFIIEELERFGVRIIFPDSGPADPRSRHHQVAATVAEYSRQGSCQKDREGKAVQENRGW